MTATTETAIHAGIVDAIEVDVSPLLEASEILVVGDAPSTHQNERFSVQLDARNTRKMRDRAGRQVRASVHVRVVLAQRLNPKDQAKTQVAGYGYADSIMDAVLTKFSEAPLGVVRALWESTSRAIVNREWYYTTIVLELEADMALPGAT